MNGISSDQKVATNFIIFSNFQSLWAESISHCWDSAAPQGAKTLGNWERAAGERW